MSDFGTEKPNPVARKVTELVEPVVEDLGYELVEVQFNREQHGQILRVVIYDKAGIGIEDCAKVSREISHLLEVEDPIDRAFNLEVTSPGLDWRLRDERDLVRFMGKKARVVLIDQPEAVVGRIGEIKNGAVAVESEEGQEWIPISSIKKAKLVIEF